MLDRMSRPLFVAVVASVVMVWTVVATAAVRTEAVADKNTVTVVALDRPVVRYRYAGVPMKPYVDQLFSPSGVQVLRDSAPGHEHHHGLMLATAVNGADFWPETPGCGTQKKRSLRVINHAVPDGLWRFGVAEELDWINPKTKAPLLVESRVVCAVKDEGLFSRGFGATLIDWHSILRTPDGKKSAVLTGAHYYGLGLRFVESMDTGGRFFNADDNPGKIVGGDEKVTPVKWCAYTAKAEGKRVTVAVFAHPENLRHPAEMFMMNTPFAYISATCNVWKKPLTIEAGKPLDLRYAVAVWDGAVDKATIEKLYQSWLKLSRQPFTDR